MPQEKKGTNPRVSKDAKAETAIAAEIKEQPQCHIHDKVFAWLGLKMRQNVCVNDLPLTKYTDGKHYCLFHLPTRDKDTEKFEEIFRARLNSVEEIIAALEELSEDEREKSKSKLSYDFEYVWFPSEVDLVSYKFHVNANFSSATFSSSANFSLATFSSNAYFNSTSFSSIASFNSTTFSSGASFLWATFFFFTDFSSTTFSSNAYFNSATFSSFAYFNSATFSFGAKFLSTTFSSSAGFGSVTFSSFADFSSATFSSFADFSSAKFEETSQIFFYQTFFRGVVDFSQAVVKGYLYFEAGEGEFFDGEWLDDEKTHPKMVKRRTSMFEGRLEFAHVRAEKPERITFNKVRLRPNWFVNIDSRKFVFTDIAWENHRARKRELKQELISLTRREYKKPHNYQLLTVAFRNLAANAEEFNRFEEASNFRKSASECERLERLNRQRKLWRAFRAQKGKSFFELWRRRKEARFDFVHFLYRWLSYYGENWRRAFLWLWVIWIVFALGFYLLGEFGTEQNREYLGFGKSFAYSLFVMTLQKPDPRPLSTVTYILYGLETIFAPVQAALLALAIRRKFMR